VEEYHASLVAWYKVIYVYGLLLEYKMEAVLYAVFEDEFAVTVMNDHIDRLSNYLLSLNVKGAFTVLKKTSSTLRDTLRDAMNNNKVLDLTKMTTPAGLIYAEIDCAVLIAYGTLYDTHLGTIDGIYTKASAIAKALKNIVFESDTPNGGQHYLRPNYDITTIADDHWPSRNRPLDPNTKANYATVKLPQSQHKIAVKRAFSENVCDIGDVAVDHEYAQEKNINKRARISQAGIY